MRIPVDLLRRALPSGGAGLRMASVAVDLDPLEVVRAAADVFPSARFFGSAEGRQLGALGTAWREIAPAGPDRLDRLAARCAELDLGEEARFLFGFSFDQGGPQRPEWDGFPAAVAVLPEVLVERDPEGASRLTVALAPGRDPDPLLEALEGLRAADPPGLPEAADHVLEARPSPTAWREAVAEAVSILRAGDLAKVVLARSVGVRWEGPCRPLDLTALLRQDYLRCHVFAWREGESTFLGASPELLVQRRGPEVRSHPLAGSAARGEGEEEDRRLGESLLASAKDRAEHALVVEDVAARLRPLTRELWVAPEPRLSKMATVQHLSSEISGLLAEPRSVLELASVLHPTPAVGGTPRQEALAFIDKIEEIDRGWYAGGIGWMDARGDGEVAVALRCALVRDQEAHVFAGAGIMADSDPEAELAETRLKLRPMLELLAAT